MGDSIFPVDVISMCSADGDIRPLRLRMEDEEHQLLRIDTICGYRSICIFMQSKSKGKAVVV